MKRLKIFTWHIHGSYLYYLAQAPHDFYIPTRSAEAFTKISHPPEGYYGRTKNYAWPANLHEVPAEEACRLKLDCLLFQSPKNYLKDQYEILSAEQRKLPSIYLEHDPPREHPTDTKHVVQSADTFVVHVTSFNDLMWDCGPSPTRVIDHGVIIPEEIRYRGGIAKGISVVNNLKKRGRRLGLDVFESVRNVIPLDLVGMGATEVGGLGEVPYSNLAAFESRYRFFFNPIRYTSLGLSLCEAMMVGMPIVGLATTELVTVIENGVSGFIDTDINKLIPSMKELLRSPKLAKELGEAARKKALSRFSIHRFVDDWNYVLNEITGGTLTFGRSLWR